MFCRYGLPGPNEAKQSLSQASSLPAAATASASDVLESDALASSHAQQVVTVEWSINEETISVSLAVTLIGHAAQQPVLIQPTSVAIAGNSSAKFTVTFSSTDTMLHEGYLLGTQQLVSAGDTPLRLHCGVVRDAASTQADDGQSRTSLQSRASGSQSSANLAGSEQQQDSVLGNDDLLVSCHISGGFHPYAAPPSAPLQPLTIPTKGHVIQPHLEPEFPDTTDSLSFTCCATHDPSTHPSYTQPMVLTNMHSCKLQFTVSSQAGTPFHIIKVVPGAVSRLAGLQTVTSFDGVRSGKEATAKGLLDDSIVLQPHEHVAVHVGYSPQRSKQSETLVMQNAAADKDSSAAQGSEIVPDESASGSLLVTYQNGELQHVPIQARCLHPALQPAVARVEFGLVHLHSPKILQLEMLNPTTVDATWSAQVESCSRVGESNAVTSVSFATHVAHGMGTSLQSLSTAQVMQSGAASGSGFVCSPAVGTLAGRGLGMPRKLQLSVKFAPTQLGVYSACLTVRVANGSTFKVALTGEGTLTEADEVQAKLKGII